MTYLDNFSSIKSPIKKVIYKHTGVTISFENKKKIKINPYGDCCSISYIINFKEFPFSKIIGKEIKTLKEVKNKKKIDNLYKNAKLIDYSNTNDNFNKYHLYEIKFTDKTSFNFGLVNASNGYYDGWIEVIEE